MANEPYNLVQVTFVPPAGPHDPPVRFFDEQGQVAKLVERFSAAQVNYGDAAATFQSLSMESGHIEAVAADMKRATQRMNGMRGQAKALMLGQLSAVLKGSQRVAVALSNGLFRVAEPSEYDTLLARARAATGVRILLLEPLDLLGSQNKLLGSLL